MKVSNQFIKSLVVLIYSELKKIISIFIGLFTTVESNKVTHLLNWACDVIVLFFSLSVSI
jgi:hypothetical protein